MNFIFINVEVLRGRYGRQGSGLGGANMKVEAEVEYFFVKDYDGI